MNELKAVGDYYTWIDGYKIPLISVKIYGRHKIDCVTHVEICGVGKRMPKITVRIPVSKEARRNQDKYRRYVERRKLKSEVQKILGGVCGRCQYGRKNGDCPDILEIDHIRNDGASRRKDGERHESLLRWIRKNPDKARLDFQLLCPNCNRLKHNENIRLQWLKYIF